MPTPRLFIVRHGETTWSLSGRHTSHTDLPLTPVGEIRIRTAASVLIGPGRPIVPSRLSRIYVSPRQRARKTLELLLGEGFAGCEDVRIEERVREWEYGAFEGLTSQEVGARRRGEEEEEEEAQGLRKRGEWDIWNEGCPGGEKPEDVVRRVDEVIREIREEVHAGVLSGEETGGGDVLIVAHGHVLRALAGRWVGKEIGENPKLILEAGGVGILSYEHGRLEEPAILLGGAFVAEEQ